MNEERGFTLLKKEILRKGFDCSHYRDRYLRRRIRIRMERNKVMNPDAYRLILKNDPAEYNQLMDCLAINVTQFFRDPTTYEVIKSQIIPQILENKKRLNSRVIRIWSAGCATGEEPYSLVMVIKELLGARMDDYHVSIYATDLDQGALSRAETGIYEESHFSTMKATLQRKYFTPYQGKYELSERIKEMVKFKQMNLISAEPILNVDLLLCRNLLIYIDENSQLIIFDKFYQSLNRGGYLVLGKAETLPGDFLNRFKIIDRDERIYEKI